MNNDSQKSSVMFLHSLLNEEGVALMYINMKSNHAKLVCRIFHS